MKITHLIFLLTFIVSTLPVCAADPSPEIQQVLKVRLVGKHDLNVKDLTGATPTPEQTKRLVDTASYESYQVPSPKGAADYYSYSIYRFNDTGEIWIIRSGGFAGQSDDHPEAVNAQRLAAMVL